MSGGRKRRREPLREGKPKPKACTAGLHAFVVKGGEVVCKFCGTPARPIRV